MNVPVAANVLGTIGAVCWSVQLLPQILLNYRRHSAAGLQPSFMMTWALAGVPLAVFNTVQRFNVALQIQPQILTSLSLLTWTQCCYYESRWPLRKCLAVIAPLILLMAALETALILSIRVALDRHIEWPATLMGVLAGVLLCCGVLREYWDIYTHDTVRGISFLFCGIDAAGDFFSVLSVLYQPRYDFVAIGLYSAEFLLWCGIFCCGIHYRLIPWLKRCAAARTRLAHLPTTAAAQLGSQVEGTAISMRLQDSSLQRTPSSTSVFRTPSEADSDGSLSYRRSRVANP